VYEDVKDIPEGTTVKDGNEILPISERQKVRYEAHFSDRFRTLVVFKNGGWYSDMDEVCLRPLDSLDPYVFISEYRYDGEHRARTKEEQLVNCCLFKAPAGCPFLKAVIDGQSMMDALSLPKYSIELGPVLFRNIIPLFHLEQYVAPPEVYDALGPDELKGFTDRSWGFNQEARTAHLRQSYWSPETGGFDPDAVYPPESLFEQLKVKHGVPRKPGLAPFKSPVFRKSAEELERIVKPYTMLAPERIRLLIELAEKVELEQIPGDMVECGVCNGGSAAILAHMAAWSRLSRATWLFDSFTGLPQNTTEDDCAVDGSRAEDQVGRCVGNIESVREVLRLVGADFTELNIVVGRFYSAFRGVSINRIAMLNLDSDWYWSERFCLEKFYPYVSPGGIVYLDDYFYWPGCQRAAEEFFSKREEPHPQFNRVGHSMWLQKGHCS
jgi:O-methyltransferase